MQVRLYEDIARFGHIATTYDYPASSMGATSWRSSPIPKFDNPKMDHMPALQLFGAGREKASMPSRPIPRRKASTSKIIPSQIQRWSQPCALCGADDSYLDEVVIDDKGKRMFVCSDTYYCEGRRAQGHVGTGLRTALGKA